MQPNQMRKTLETAMQDKAPKAYLQLKGLKQLDQYLDGLTGRTLESIAEAKAQAGASKATRESPEYQADGRTRMQDLNSKFRVIEEQAIKQAVDEIEGLKTTEFSPEN